jgi:hypothetical protein
LAAAGAALTTGTGSAQDDGRAMREWAQAWGLEQIALIQAAAGDVPGAKRTVAQIDEDFQKGESRVTLVTFREGRPIYYEPCAPVGLSGCVRPASPGVIKRPAHRTPIRADVVPGLPPNYLAADPRHGAVVDFTDEYDSRGTRVTSRTYADGAVVIETPAASAGTYSRPVPSVSRNDSRP